MDDTVECEHHADWDRAISETASPVAEISLGGPEEHLSEIAMRLDRLDAHVDAIKLSLMKMYIYVTVGQRGIRQRAIDACLAAGVQSVPVDRMEEDVHRVLAEILAEVQ